MAARTKRVHLGPGHVKMGALGMDRTDFGKATGC